MNRSLNSLEIISLGLGMHNKSPNYTFNHKIQITENNESTPMRKRIRHALY